ncbi:hypothetical protein H6G45_13385 [Synechocystis sp. FACHB-383]|uniref:hypothetical protein n=1 Tax=Synechocystis sp. FACHB-383 TaxID=2692864 RepID=UPI0016896325|nr:hypothetical protein [Synechocystis sp. FACHB-383]MBD2654456.1 hypothetical protein [Synechocystis sp. FACHB-383]
MAVNEVNLFTLPLIVAYSIYLKFSRKVFHYLLSVISGQIAFLFIHLLYKPDSFHKSVSINPKSALSGILYQYQQVEYIKALPNLYPWIRSLSYLISVIVFITMAVIIIKNYRLSEGKPKSVEIVFFAFLPIFATGIYSLSGGFSLDSRKAYVIWAFLLISFFFFVQLTPQFLQKIVVIFVLAVSPFLVLSTQSVVNATVETTTLLDKAYVFIKDRNELQSPFTFKWHPSIYDSWPNYSKFTGFRLDDYQAVRAAVGDRRKHHNGHTTNLVYDQDRNFWYLQNTPNSDSGNEIK